MEVPLKLNAGFFAIVAIAVVLIPSAGSAVASPVQEQAGASLQQKINSLKKLRDAGLLSQDEYQAKINALRNNGNASAPVATAHAGPLVWPGTRTVQITDPEHNGMLTETLAIPANWKFAGTVDRSGANTCHAGDLGPKFTMQSPDGLYQVAELPGVIWTRDNDPRRVAQMYQNGCPTVDISSSADFMAKILLAQMHPNAKIARVLDAGPGLLQQMEARYQSDYAIISATNPLTGTPIPEFKFDGSRMRIEYTLNGVPMEEVLSGFVECKNLRMPNGSTLSNCLMPEILLVRAPLGQLESLLAMPEFGAMMESAQMNPDWVRRCMDERMAKLQQIVSQVNRDKAQFAAMMRASDAAFQARTQAYANLAQTITNSNRQFNQQMQQSTNASIARAQASQRSLDHDAYEHSLYYGDKAEFTNPYNGQTVISSNKYAQQFISNNGQYVVQTGPNDNANNYVGPGGETFAPLIPH
jgi:hypothetical protein